MKALIARAILLGSLLGAGEVVAQSSCKHAGAESDLLRLTAYTNLVTGGGVSGDFNEPLHGHDPERGFKLQGLELGAFSNLTTYVQGYANLNLFVEDGKLESEWEEGYLKIHRLPYGFEVRAGRFYNLVGTQNNLHLHDWNFADADLMTSAFLGEDGLAINGGELSWYYIYENYGVVGLNLAAGRVVAHGAHAESASSGGSGGAHDHGDEMAGFDGSLLSLRATWHHYVNDYHQHFLGMSGVLGENGYGQENYLLEMDYTYSWNNREGEDWGASFDGTIQLGIKNTEWVHPDDANISGNGDQASLMLQGVYGFAENWTASLRAEWVEGLTDGGLLVAGETEYAIDEQQARRLSLACTRDLQWGENYSGKVRLQYNWEKRGDIDDHIIWLQIGAGASWSW